ncbi:MAG: aldo/keto reductase [Lachnospiraceae bacterium]|nr:aldo/keto reductase [Lachnospiraceae bacterium]
MMKLGGSDLEVSRLGVGCMRMESLTVEQAERFVLDAVEQGINFFDHADIYGGGNCERLFGEVLKRNPGLREKLVLQSKAGICPEMYDNSREHLLEAADGILERLGTDHLDVFLIHRPDALVEPEEVAEAFDRLHASGKVRYFGVSNHKPMQMELLSRYLKQQLLVDQLQFSITNSNMVRNGMEVNMETEGAADRDGSVLDYCRLKDITIQAWSPFQYGMFEGTFLGNPRYEKLNGVLKELAEKYETTDTAIASAWIFRHPAKIQLLAGTMNPVRLAQINRAQELALTREEWYRIYLAADHILP